MPVSVGKSLIAVSNSINWWTPSKGRTRGVQLEQAGGSQECIWNELKCFIPMLSNEDISLQDTQLPLDHFQVKCFDFFLMAFFFFLTKIVSF